MTLSPKHMLVVPALALALGVFASCSDDSNNSPTTSVGTGSAVTTGVSAATTGAGGAVTTSATSGAVTTGS